MSKEIINSKNNQKIKSYCDTCVCGSCEKLEAYQLSENEAKEIIAELEYKIKILEKELKTYKCQEKFPGQCRCACRCLGNEFCIDADKKINELKKENEKLKEVTSEAKIEYENLLINRNNFAVRVEKLEQENKGLKQQIETDKNQINYFIEENEELKKYQYKQEYLQDEIEKRQKALVEIREIVSGNYEILDPQVKQDIKKLIDEVLNDRD